MQTYTHTHKWPNDAAHALCSTPNNQHARKTVVCAVRFGAAATAAARARVCVRTRQVRVHSAVGSYVVGYVRFVWDVLVMVVCVPCDVCTFRALKTFRCCGHTYNCEAKRALLWGADVRTYAPASNMSGWVSCVCLYNIYMQCNI